MADQTELRVALELNRVALFIKWKGKKYFVPEGGSWHSTAIVRETEDGTIEMRPFEYAFPFAYDDRWAQVEEEIPNVSSLTLAQWREFIEQIKNALDELTAAGKPETHRLELLLPEELPWEAPQ